VSRHGAQPATPADRDGGAARLAAGVDALVDAAGRATAWVTLVIVVLMATNVLLRYGFSVGSVWSQELEWHLLVPLVMVGMSYALLKGDHVRVDVFYARYGERCRALADLISALLAVGFGVLAIRYALGYVGQSWAIGEISPDPGGLPARWFLKALIPAGFALFVLQASAQALQAGLRWRRAGLATAGSMSGETP
jgi:TRAP-type mannitol/chloroaromatic compound transport system permease small subunit